MFALYLTTMIVGFQREKKVQESRNRLRHLQFYKRFEDEEQYLFVDIVQAIE